MASKNVFDIFNDDDETISFDGQDEFKQYLERNLDNCCSGVIIRNYNNSGINYKIISTAVETQVTLLDSCKQGVKKVMTIIKKSDNTSSTNSSKKITINLELTLEENNKGKS